MVWNMFEIVWVSIVVGMLRRNWFIFWALKPASYPVMILRCIQWNMAQVSCGRLPVFAQAPAVVRGWGTREKPWGRQPWIQERLWKVVFRCFLQIFTQSTTNEWFDSGIVNGSRWLTTKKWMVWFWTLKHGWIVKMARSLGFWIFKVPQISK